MFKKSTVRRHLIVKEEDLTTVLGIINSEIKISKQNQMIGNCGWKNEPEKWFIHFEGTIKECMKITEKLEQIGTFKEDSVHILFERRA